MGGGRRSRRAQLPPTIGGGLNGVRDVDGDVPPHREGDAKGGPPDLGTDFAPIGGVRGLARLGSDDGLRVHIHGEVLDRWEAAICVAYTHWVLKGKADPKLLRARARIAHSKPGRH
jgi:hypothetical protein